MIKIETVTQFVATMAHHPSVYYLLKCTVAKTKNNFFALGHDKIKLKLENENYV